VNSANTNTNITVGTSERDGTGIVLQLTDDRQERYSLENDGRLGRQSVVTPQFFQGRHEPRIRIKRSDSHGKRKMTAIEGYTTACAITTAAAGLAVLALLRLGQKKDEETEKNFSVLKRARRATRNGRRDQKQMKTKKRTGDQ